MTHVVELMPELVTIAAEAPTEVTRMRTGRPAPRPSAGSRMLRVTSPEELFVMDARAELDMGKSDAWGLPFSGTGTWPTRKLTL